MTTLKERFRGRPKEQWRGAYLSVRLSFLENDLVVLHPENVNPLSEIRRLYRRCLVTGNGRAIRIVGGSGSGKSHFLKLLRMLLPNVETDDATLVRLVVFKIPNYPAPEKMAKSLLLAMGDPAWNFTRDSMSRVWEMIRQAGVFVIAIDDVQDIPEHRGKVGLRITTNWIRELIDESKCLVVLVGTQASERVVISNPQTRRRDPTKFLLTYFKISSEKEVARFKRFLREVDDLMPMAEFSGLEGYAKQLYWATNGIADYIFKILEEAMEFAVLAGREKIIQEDLARGFVKLFQDAAKELNPFAPGWSGRLLDGAGEPFEAWAENATIERDADRSKKSGRRNAQ